MNTVVYAMAAGQPAGSHSVFLSFLPIILIFLVLYFLMIRPQQKKQQEHQRMLGLLKKGDRVVTTSGIFGTVVGIKGDVVVLKIADNVKVEFLKGAIARQVTPERKEKSERKGR